MRLAIDAQATELERRRDGLLAPAAPQDRLHAKEKLAHAERLDDVVVRAELEPDDAIDLLALRRHHHDRGALRRRLALERATDLGARNVRQHQIEEHQIRRLLTREPQPLLPTRRRRHVVTCLSQVVRDHLLQIAFVFDHENACHFDSSYSPNVTRR